MNVKNNEERNYCNFEVKIIERTNKAFYLLMKNRLVEFPLIVFSLIWMKNARFQP